MAYEAYNRPELDNDSAFLDAAIALGSTTLAAGPKNETYLTESAYLAHYPEYAGDDDTDFESDFYYNNADLGFLTANGIALYLQEQVSTIDVK